MASTRNSAVETQLPKVRIYATDDGEYLLLEQEIFERALIQSLKNLERSQKLVLFVVVEIVPMSERVVDGIQINYTTQFRKLSYQILWNG